MGDLYADIIIDISHEALDKVFQYRVPFSLSGEISPGVRVIVPFGKNNKETEGYCIALGNPPAYEESKIKEILRLAEGGNRVEGELIDTAMFLKKEYGSSTIQALRTVMPVKVQEKKKLKKYLHLLLPREEALYLLEEWKRKHYVAKVRLMLLLLEKDKVSKDEVKATKLAWKEVEKLADQGILSIESRVEYRNPFAGFEKKEPDFLANVEQQAAIDKLTGDFDAGIRKTYLLYGVTGSGKTEVYLSMIRHVIEKGKQAIVLVPEISLTYQTVKRFYERFGDRIVVMHSRMSKGERSDAYDRVRNGDADVVVGARSALFAPCERLGLIIIDEEHDGAYKSDTTPKYHARETAIYRAQKAGARLVLGSATPSVESFYLSEIGVYERLTLKKRAGNAMLPQVSIVDLREEFKQGNRSVFSTELKSRMEDRLRKNEQTVLFLNRRGYAGFVSCRACGEVAKCPHCDVSLTYHRNGQLHCHYCGYHTAYSRVCSKCHAPFVAAFGLGTEKVEAALYKEFPGIRVLRMDNDTTQRKHAHEDILRKFAAGEADVLLGTQMIVKGHDYPNVTLVGVLAADLSLHAGDYRSGEQTFQLLCQAAGRAGRGDKAGNVVIQTYSPDHYAIQSAAAHSYENFYAQEMAFRKLLNYPPCAHFLVILVQSLDEKEAILSTQRIQQMIKKSQEEEAHPVELLSPGAASLSKLKDVYRQVIYVKHAQKERLISLRTRLEPVLENHPLFAGVQIQFDLDPMSHY